MDAYKLVAIIFGAVLVFYVVADTVPDASIQLNNVNSSVKGYNLYRLLPLVLVFVLIFGFLAMAKMRK